jgi:hypothetical protein
MPRGGLGLRNRQLGGVILTRQRNTGRLRQDHFAVGIVKTADQTHLPLRSVHIPPRQPDAVRRSQVRFALETGQRGAGEDEFFLRYRVLRVLGFVVKRVDGQLAVDQDG